MYQYLSAPHLHSQCSKTTPRTCKPLTVVPSRIVCAFCPRSIEEEAEAELVLAAAVRDLSETPSSTGDRLTVLTVDVNLAASIAWLKAEAPGLDYQKQVSLNTLKQRRHGNGKPAWVGCVCCFRARMTSSLS